MNNSNGVKFIRVRGRIVPVRQKADGNVDKRHVSKLELARQASKKKVSVKKVARFALAGAGVGGLFGGIHAAQVGALIGAAMGATTVVTKQDVANRLKRRKLAK